jgi:hypothetical protein
MKKRQNMPVWLKKIGLALHTLPWLVKGTVAAQVLWVRLIYIYIEGR